MPLTPSAVSISFASLGALISTLLSSSTFAAVQDEPVVVPDPMSEIVPPPEPEFEPEPEPDPEPAVLPTLHVTVVGTAFSAATLERALGPALQSSYKLRFSSAYRFAPPEFFRSRSGSPASIHVWVDTTTSGEARLYFANREGTRYLMRTLTLSERLDEMDREALAQAIEWSLQALDEGSAGLTRSEAEALLSEAPSGASPTPSAADVKSRQRPAFRRRSEGWLPEVALLHRWAPHSAQLFATQGPVLRLGLDRLSGHHQLGFSVGAQYQHPQRYAETGVALELTTVASRVDARYLATGLVDGSGIGLRLGVGLDTAFSSHEALDSTRFEAMDSRTSSIPLFTSGIVWQVRVEPSVRLELSVGAEVDLVRIHYNVDTSDGTRNLLSRWPARPSASVGVGLF